MMISTTTDMQEMVTTATIGRVSSLASKEEFFTGVDVGKDAVVIVD